MQKVVITGLGLVSCIGNTAERVIHNLRHGISGITVNEDFINHGLRSHVSGKPQDVNFEEHIERRQLRFMGDAAAYAHIALNSAIDQAGLKPEQISNPRTGLIIGSGGASPHHQIQAAEILATKGVRRIGPYQVTKTMGSTVSACLATNFKIKGISYSITSACATSAHCIGVAAQQIQFGLQDVMFAGGGEELSWEMAMLFDGMGALSTSYNDRPTAASRPYDKNRDGFVIAGGAAVLVLESLEHARARGATILAELVGYGASSDGQDMVAPSGAGAEACMRQALAQAGCQIDYINTHGTSTPVGDSQEVLALKNVFSGAVPPFSSTKSLTGHSQGATGAHEAIFSILMLNNNFITGSINVEDADESTAGLNLVTTTQNNVELNTVMSNSFGFGGTNACLIFKKFG